MLFSIGLICFIIGVVLVRSQNDTVVALRNIERMFGRRIRLSKAEIVYAILIMGGAAMMVLSIVILAWKHLP